MTGPDCYCNAYTQTNARPGRPAELGNVKHDMGERDCAYADELPSLTTAKQDRAERERLREQCPARWPESLDGTGGDWCQTPLSEPHTVHDAIATGGWLSWCDPHRFGGELAADEGCLELGCDLRDREYIAAERVAHDAGEHDDEASTACRVCLELMR